MPELHLHLVISAGRDRVVYDQIDMCPVYGRCKEAGPPNA